MNSYNKILKQLENIGWEKIFLLVIAGVLLIVMSGKKTNKDTTQKDTAFSEVQTYQDVQEENDQYVKNMEKRLTSILEKVEGVGKVEVMITLKTSKESVLNKDVSEDDSKEENVQETQTDTNYTKRKQEETILSDQEGNAAPYIVKEISPEVAGVIIAFEGADKKSLAETVAQAASILFDLPLNHIKLLKLEVSS